MSPRSIIKNPQPTPAAPGASAARTQLLIPLGIGLLVALVFIGLAWQSPLRRDAQWQGTLEDGLKQQRVGAALALQASKLTALAAASPAAIKNPERGIFQGPHA